MLRLLFSGAGWFGCLGLAVVMGAMKKQTISEACLSSVCSHSENDGRLIGNNGVVSEALMQRSKSENLASSEAQLAPQAKMHGQEM